MARVEDFLAQQCRDRPDAPAVTDSIGTRWSYADLDTASTALGEVLREAGVSANDRVLMLSENCASALAVLFACWKLDAVAIPVNARQTGAEVDRIVAHASPAAIISRFHECQQGDPNDPENRPHQCPARDGSSVDEMIERKYR